jgi:hypothetical protein
MTFTTTLPPRRKRRVAMEATAYNVSKSYLNQACTTDQALTPIVGRDMYTSHSHPLGLYAILFSKVKKVKK